jgi:putative spermidine/putrescine transport system ATP-binding protein
MPHLSVFENVAFPLRVRGMGSAAIREKVAKALDLVRLTGFDERRPRELSGGQQQRVSLARAIVYEPKVILMDEPLGALDKQLREEMQIEIRHLHVVLGTTIIYVTHDQEEALSMSTNIALVSDGLIREVGPPQEIYFKPKSKFAASFVGTSNLLSSTYEGSEGRFASVRLPDNSRVRGIAHDKLAPGDRVNVMFRPESVEITQDENVSPEYNVVEGDVFDHFLQGATWKTIVAVGASDRVMVQRLSQSASHLPRNTKVRLFWHPDNTHLLTR